MGNFGETIGKKERDKKNKKKRQDKLEKMEWRKANAKKGKTLEDMMAYVDENGNLSSKKTLSLTPKSGSTNSL